MEINNKAVIFDIQGHSVHDGPGARTLVFLKGCNLSCYWCSNPEGQHPFPELMYNQDKCINDNLCVKACNLKAVNCSNNTLYFDRIKCKQCTDFKCESVCCSSAIKIAGKEISADELIVRIKRDRPFWGDSGGVTFTGGEPLLHYNFLLEVLTKCYGSYIHTGIETCGYVQTSHLRDIFPYTDWIFFDIKHVNREKHLKYTSADNDQILKNVKIAANEFKGRLVFRMVIIPGFNDSEREIIEFADFINSLNLREKEVNLLPVHHMGISKYKMLGRKYYADNLPKTEPAKLKILADILISKKIKCYLGADTPF